MKAAAVNVHVQVLCGHCLQLHRGNTRACLLCGVGRVCSVLLETMQPSSKMCEELDLHLSFHLLAEHLLAVTQHSRPLIG